MITFWSFSLLIAFLFSSCSDSACESCIYKRPDTQFNFEAWLVENDSEDTTHYSVLLESGTSLFLFQNKLNYKVLKFESYKMKESKFKSESVTGFKEDSGYIWLHPPRTDKFKRITQLAPYPQINLPPEIGKVYEGNLNMATNWGDWTGKSSTYKLQIDSSYFEPVINEETYVLSGCGWLESDTCCVRYLFSKTHGFYEWNYTWNDSLTFTMKLKGL